MASTTRPVQSVSNTELYSRWAKVYDTDGNILQAMDDHLLPDLLSQAYALLKDQTAVTITELGAGTGRNTAKLLLPITSLPSDELPPQELKLDIKQINALDLSPAMLEVAEKRCNDILSNLSTNQPRPALHFHGFDALNPENFPAIQDSIFNKANLVLSTLVLEHLPLSTFFSIAENLLSPPSSPFVGDRILVLTNMHSDMGDVSRAGFVDEVTGQKIRGDSYSHRIEDVVVEAERWGFMVLGEVRQREVREEDVGEGRVLGERGRKWIGIRVWFGCVLRWKGL